MLTRRAVVLIATLAMTGACRRTRDDGDTPEKVEIPAALQGLEFSDENGSRLSEEVLRGKMLALNFMFTSCPQVCPTQTRELVEVQKAIPRELKSRVHFLSVSVDPENDTAEARKAFARAHGANTEGWTFAATSPEGTRELASRVNAFDSRRASPAPADHTTSLYLFDSRGRLVQRYAGMPVDRERLVREISALDQLTRS